MATCRKASRFDSLDVLRFFAPRPIAHAVASALFLTAPALWAGPAGEQVVAGQANVSRNGTNTLVTQTTDRAAINWQSLNIGATESVRFAQPSTSSIALNRVLGQDPTSILGSLSANGQVFILNPNGVLFGQGAQVNVGGLVASTLSLSNSDFLAGRFSFLNEAATGTVANAGNIIANGGYVALIGPQVKNAGTITAANGRVALAAGEKITLNLDGNKLISLAVDQGALNALVENKGLIKADGGQVLLTSKSADAVIKSVVNNEGVVEAAMLTETAGIIRLEADNTINVGTLRASGDAGGSVTLRANNLLNNTGSVEATGAAATGGVLNLQGDVVVHTGKVNVDGVTGGTVNVTGRNVLLAGNASANALHGAAGNINIEVAERLIQTSQSKLSADSAGGAGGNVSVRSAQSVLTSGTLTAIGDGAGTGGKVDVLGATITLLAATIDASGQQGGGTIRIGGDFQGKNPEVVNAQTTTINQATTIRADAKTNGDGGRVIVWSDQKTRFDGLISARGGSVSGNGGFVEVSGKENLSFSGLVDAGAANGKAGTLLLDPKNIVIDDTGFSMNYVALIDPSPTAEESLGGGGITVLPNNNILVRSSGDSFMAKYAGAVYLLSGTTGALISTLTGTNQFDFVGSTASVVLPNGNYLVQSPNWASSSGAVTFGKGDRGVSGVVSAANSLVGSQPGDLVGSDYQAGVVVLPSGNYVVSSPTWSNGKGAVTWGNGNTGVSGLVSSANSLTGSQAGDSVGGGAGASGRPAILSNGNYLVFSPRWSDSKGAVTWVDGAKGFAGIVSSANSLVGSQSGDFVGSSGYAATGFSRSNYVISSPFWSNRKGAVTWGNGETGVAGVVSAENSLIGSRTGDAVGSTSSGSYVFVLPNGNYVVPSPGWSNNTGAVTWGNGSTGVMGVVSAANSLVGSQAGDYVGGNGVWWRPTDGNYLVFSPHWNKDAGAVTWGNGATGVVGFVTATNSLVGGQSGDGFGLAQYGGAGVTWLPSGNYVITSSGWGSGKGAVTWGNGATGTSGVVSAANSLVGSQSGDFIGNSGPVTGAVTVLPNGNYLVFSPNWANSAGAVTWGNGSTGVTGVVSSANSLVGSQSGDGVGSGSAYAYGNVPILANGNYLVVSPSWSNNKGAVTWGDSATGTTGAVSAANSLVGAQSGDAVGGVNLSVTLLTNGNYVVSTPTWANGAGAVTWGDGGRGTVGVVSSANSLVGGHGNVQGSNTGDFVGGSPYYASVTALPNGNYVIVSSFWSGRGAITWGDGLTGVKGGVSSVNSLVGSQFGDYLGNGNFFSPITVFRNSNFVVSSPSWDNGRGAVTWVNGETGIAGVVSSVNSLVGRQSGDRVGDYRVIKLTNDNYLVMSSAAGAATWGNGTTGITGVISPTNSLMGTQIGNNNSGASGDVTLLPNGNYVIRNPQWDNDKGAVTWGNGATGVTGIVSSANSLVGSQSGDRIGGGFSRGVTVLRNGDYVVSSYLNGLGAITWGNGVTGVSGVVSGANSLVGSVSANPTYYFNGYRLVTELPNGGFIAGNPSADIGSIVGAGQIVLALPAATGLTYDAAPGATSAISPKSIASITNTGTAVVLQANNDIIVNSAIVTDNPYGNGGALTLQAGRSIMLNKGIITDNGNLTLIANDTLGNGVVDANRDPGTAVIRMASAAGIDAGAGEVKIELSDGSGKTNTGSGDITLDSITAGKIQVLNRGATTGNIVINSGATLGAGSAGTAIEVAAVSGGGFVNNAGADALKTSNGRWLVWSTNPANDVRGGLRFSFAQNNATFGVTAPAQANGNGFLFRTTNTSRPPSPEVQGAIASAYSTESSNAFDRGHRASTNEFGSGHATPGANSGLLTVDGAGVNLPVGVQ